MERLFVRLKHLLQVPECEVVLPLLLLLQYPGIDQLVEMSNSPIIVICPPCGSLADVSFNRCIEDRQVLEEPVRLVAEDLLDDACTELIDLHFSRPVQAIPLDAGELIEIDFVGVSHQYLGGDRVPFSDLPDPLSCIFCDLHRVPTGDLIDQATSLAFDKAQDVNRCIHIIRTAF